MALLGCWLRTVDDAMMRYRQRLLFFAASIVALSLFLADSAFKSYGLILSLCVLFFYAMRRILAISGASRFFIWMLLLALILKVFLLLTLHSTIAFPDEINHYDPDGWQKALDWRGEGPAFALNPNTHAYVGFVSVTYFVVGHLPLIPKLIGMFLSVLLAFILMRLAMLIFDDATAKVVWLSSLFFPSLILWSSVLLRDIFIVFILWLGLGYASIFLWRRPLQSFFFMVAAVFALYSLRPHVAIMLLATSLLAFVVVLAIKWLLRSERVWPAFAGIAVIALLSFLIAPVALQSIIPRSYADAPLEKIQAVRSTYLATGNTAFDKDADISTLDGILEHLPTGLAHFLFAPFPWQVSSVKELLGVINSLLLYAFMIFGIYGVARMRKKHLFSLLPAFLFVLVLTLFSAIIEGNVGTAMRHRAQIVPLILLLGSYGLAQTRRFRRVFA